MFRHLITAICIIFLLSPVPLKASEILDSETVRAVQQFLHENGYDCGTVDGIAGKNTRNAISQYESDHRMDVTGMITEALLESMFGMETDVESQDQTKERTGENQSLLGNFALSKNLLYGQLFYGYYNEQSPGSYDISEIPSECLGYMIEDLDGDGEEELLLAVIDERKDIVLEVYETDGQTVRKASILDSDAVGHRLSVSGGPGILDVFLYQNNGWKIGVDDSYSGLLATGIGHHFTSLIYSNETLQMVGSADLLGSGFIPSTYEPFLSELYTLGASAILFDEYWYFDSYLIDYMQGVKEVGRIVTTRVKSEEATYWYRTKTPGVVATEIRVASRETLLSGNGSHVSTDQFIFPDSNIRLLTEEDLKSLNAQTARYARNEIFARHGRLFKSSDLQDYFDSKVWYKGVVEPDEFDNKYYHAAWGLNEIEKKNAELISEYERRINQGEALGQRSVPATEGGHENPSGYKKAYSEIITNLKTIPNDFKYYLIYVDEDDVPELVIDTGNRAAGCGVYTYNEAEDAAKNIGLIFPFQYLERKNYLIWQDGYSGGYRNYTYKITNGNWEMVAKADFYTTSAAFGYNWFGNEISEKEYDEYLNEYFGGDIVSQAISPNNPMDFYEILGYLKE